MFDALAAAIVPVWLDASVQRAIQKIDRNHMQEAALRMPLKCTLGLSGRERMPNEDYSGKRARIAVQFDPWPCSGLRGVHGSVGYGSADRCCCAAAGSAAL